MLRLPPSLSLCALPLFLLGPHLVPEPVTSSALGGGGGTGNEPPVCSIEYQGQTVTFGTISVAITPPITMVDLSGCSSFDPEGGPLTFEWQSCPGSSFSDPTACDTVLMIPTPAGSSGMCDVRLLVTDDQGQTSATYCRLAVEYFENTPPTCVLAQEDYTVYVDHDATSVTVTLDACASFDPDPQQLSFKWDGCAIASFADASACKTEMTIDLTGQTLPLVCGARLFLSDGVVTTQQCRVFVNVLPQPDLDLCPLSCPTFVHVNQRGTLRSVLVGNPYFDVNKVDTTSLVLRRADGVGGTVPFLPAGLALKDISKPVEDRVCDCAVLRTDGNMDLLTIVHVPSMVNALQLAGVANGTQVEVEVTGKLLDGTEFKAQDCVTVKQ